MKYVFLVAFILLLLASLVTWSISPSASETPVIYWVTDSNPARIDQVKLFHDWLIKNGHFVTKKFDSRDELLAFL
ncbi:MAG TPA: hypothetical protein PK402_14675, partial [Tepidisphaeraceae bacterium]|nr:hypothetical protein [Tepidisphaeraceae bacterium]